jgi:hypothetical protein
MKYEKKRIRISSGRPVSSWIWNRNRAVAWSVAFGIILTYGLFFSCAKKENEEGDREKPTASNAASPADIRNALQRLVGQWQRPDGGYVIQIRRVGAEGDLDAGYFNPRPINVSKAMASVKEGKVEVFIELYDEGYPGSTYDLTYDPGNDMLFGNYFQAAVRQDFDVVFVRMKP